MDRAIQIPLQGVMPEHSFRKKSNGELKKLGYLVGFCLVFELFLAFPVVYLLGAHFREQQPPKQEVVLGREPTMGRYSALTATASSARKTRPMVHLQAVIPTDKSCMNYFPILHWGGEKLELFKYANGVLEVPEEGDYFVYSRVTFEGCEECEKGLKNCSSLPVTHVKQIVSRGRKRYGSSVPGELLSGSTTVVAQSSVPKSKPWRKSIYLGAVFHLDEGDRLMVNVSHIKLVREMETFFGLVSLN